MATTHSPVFDSFEQPFLLETTPKPVAQAGEIIVRILTTYAIPYATDIFNGTRQDELGFPLTPVHSAVGRIEQLGPDIAALTALSLGRLVLCCPTIRSRNDPDQSLLFGFGAGHA
jgi:NADPH:quinone reductase-like Zn-dependent oxidoreductase